MKQSTAVKPFHRNSHSCVALFHERNKYEINCENALLWFKNKMVLQ